MGKIEVGNAPCSWGTLEFEGMMLSRSDIHKCSMNWSKLDIPPLS